MAKIGFVLEPNKLEMPQPQVTKANNSPPDPMVLAPH